MMFTGDEICQQLTPQLSLTRTGKVSRYWEHRRDQFIWMKRTDVIWKVERLNVADPVATPMRAKTGRLFFAHEYSVTLDDFVYVANDPKFRYVHLPTLYAFSARQINTQIFRNAFMTWPKRIFALKDEPHMRPSRFILKYNRVRSFSQLMAAKEAFSVAA